MRQYSHFDSTICIDCKSRTSPLGDSQRPQSSFPFSHLAFTRYHNVIFNQTQYMIRILCPADDH